MNSLVPVQWLAERLGDADLVILDATLPPVGVVPVVDTAARYREAHLPGAVFFDTEALSDPGTSLPHMLPDADTFGAAMGALGISESMQIVAYEQAGLFSAPRAWWMLRSFGAERVAVLDGGLRAWMAAGLPVNAGSVVRPVTTFQAMLQSGAVRSYAEVQAAIAVGEQIVDARSAARFAATAPEPRPGLRSGHMPGAVNVPFLDVTTNGFLRRPEQLQNLFSDHGIDLTEPVITTCGSGVTAAVLALALEHIGAKSVSVYDGSWAEYAQQPDAVIVTGER